MINTPTKRIIAFILSIILIFGFSGCSQKGSYSSNQISEEILELVSFPEMKELSGTSLPSHFVFQDGNVKRYSVYVSASGESADTLACFEVSDEKQRAIAITGISQYLTNLSTAFRSTMSQEYEKVENRLLVEVDNIIVLVICPDSTAVWEYLTKMGAKEVI